LLSRGPGEPVRSMTSDSVENPLMSPLRFDVLEGKLYMSAGARVMGGDLFDELEWESLRRLPGEGPSASILPGLAIGFLEVAKSSEIVLCGFRSLPVRS